MAKTCDSPSAVWIRRGSREPTPALWMHRVVVAEGVDLPGDLPHVVDGGQVADDDGVRAGQAGAGVGGPGLAAGVQGDLVAVLEQQLGGHQAQAVGGTGDEYARHQFSPDKESSSPGLHSRPAGR